MMNIKNKTVFSGIGILVGLAAVVYLGTSLIPKTLNTLVKANVKQTISTKSSLFIGQKIMAKADGLEKCVVNVFVLDSDGKGIKGKLVQLSGLGEFESLTNDSGKATFELTSKIAGQYELTASVNGTPLNNTLKVIFR